MNNRERIEAVLHGKIPDKIPFMPFRVVMPDSDFVNDLVKKGMGFINHCASVHLNSSGYEIAEKDMNGKKVIIYHTPVGEISVSYINTMTKTITSNPLGVQTDFMIKDVNDYEAAIYVIDHTEYLEDAAIYRDADNLAGGNGIIHTWTDEPPYMDAQYFLGLENWIFHQYDHPDEFKMLLDALGRRQEKRMYRILDYPDNFINLGNLAGNFGPLQFAEYMLPYFKKYTSLLKVHGKTTTLHADANNLTAYTGLVAETGVDVIEAFTPPPFGDLTLADARKAWGESKTIWINFPESVFYNGYDQTKQYTIDLINSDPCPNKFISMTEMGLIGVDDTNRKIFQDGITAIMDAIDEVGYY